MEKEISITSQEASMLSEVIASYSNGEIFTLKSAQMYCAENDKDLLHEVSKKVESLIDLRDKSNDVLKEIEQKDLSYKDSLLAVTKDENLMESIHLFLQSAIMKRIGELENQERLLLSISSGSEVYGKPNRIEFNSEFTQKFGKNWKILMNIMKVLRAETMKAFTFAQ